MKLVVLEGNVMGGHRIEDLGLTIQYKQQVRVLWDRASWSKDLSFALMSNLVTKREMVTTPLMPSRAYESRPEPLPSIVTPPTPKAPEKSLAAPETRDSKELIELRESNAALLSQMGKLMEKMDEMISAPPTVVHVASVNGNHTHTQTQSSKTSSTPDYIEDEPVMFIPSKIRSDKTKISDEIQVESDSSKGKSLDAAAEALKSMKKPSRRKKGE